jgi:hypothetical protein
MPGTGANGDPKLAGHGLSAVAVKQREQIIVPILAAPLRCRLST